MGRVRRIAVGVLSALVISGFLVAVTETPAEARKVGNPGGGFSIRVHAGAMSIGDQAFDFVDEGRTPQCSDGANNDGAQDGAIDAPDAECDAGGVGQPEANDDSETADGFQPKLPIQMTNGTLNGNGTFSFPAANVSFPPQYLFVEAPSPVGNFIVTIGIVALGPVTGAIDPVTGAMTLDMSVRVNADGGPLAADCQVSPINIIGATTGTMPAIGSNPVMSGSPYNQGNGRMTLIHNAFSVPGASNCGTYAVFVDLNDQINSQLGLPSAAGKNTASFLSEWTPRPTPGISPSFTATPSSGTSPLTVNFNASGSSGVGLTYAWDFTNNGSIDATGVTTSNIYTAASPTTFTARLRVTDSDGDFAETTRSISVGPNQPPIANSQTVNVSEDAVNAPITLSGTDPEGGALTYTRVAPNPTHGTVTCGTPNPQSCQYTPVANYNGPDSFGFRVTDPVNNGSNAVVTLNVLPVNDAPVASNVSATVLEDSLGSTVTMIATDVDGPPLTYNIVSGPTKGSFGPGTGAARTYTPNANENGTDTFTYQATDGTNSSNVATGTITITSVNDLPTAVDQVGANAVTISEDASNAPITLSGSDVEGPVTYSIVTAPGNGSLGGSLPNLTFTPASNFNGSVSPSLVFRVTDSSGAFDDATVEIVVAPVNDAPTTADVSATTVENNSVTVTIPGGDIDGDALTFTPATPTAGGGTVSCIADACTYSPATGFAGADSFTVDVSDGTDTVTSTVSVSVSAFNNAAPVINDATVVGLEDQMRSFSLVSSDADGDTRTHTVLFQPSTGVLTCDTAGACTFVPNPDANGTSTATVKVDDGRGGSDTAIITLIVVPINDAPTIPAQSLNPTEDAAVSFNLQGSDVDLDALTWSVKRAPAKGTLVCDAAGACTYTPNANANGADSFEVEADDGHGARIRITVPVTIAPVNDPPTAAGLSRSVTEDGSISFGLTGADPDGGSVTFGASPATSGALACSAAGACTFTTNPNANGTETVAYTVSDGTDTVTGALVLTIVPVNDPPVAVGQTLSTPEDAALAITLAANDPDPGDPITFQVTTAPAVGLLGGTAPNLTYVPAPNASGTVSLGFRATDAAGATSTATVTITVTPVDDLPVAGNPSATTPEDTAKAIALTGSDAEGPVTTAVVTGPAHGTYAGGVYTPALNYNGPDSIAYKVTSSTGQIVNGTVSITVAAVNDPPVATDATVVTTRTVSVPITLGGTDPDGAGTLTYTVLTGPTKGTLSGTAPNLTYTPTGFNTGSDNVTFKVTDSGGLVDSGTIGITINAGSALATQLTVAPATVVRPTGVLAFLGQNSYTNLKGTLKTTGGLPIPGKTVRFTVSGTQICTATTNASGVATCSGTSGYSTVTTYQGAFAGDSGFAASTGTGTLS